MKEVSFDEFNMLASKNKMFCYVALCLAQQFDNEIKLMYHSYQSYFVIR